MAAGERKAAVPKPLGAEAADLESVQAQRGRGAERRQREPALRLQRAVDLRDSRLGHSVDQRAIQRRQLHRRQLPLHGHAGRRQRDDRATGERRVGQPQVEHVVALATGAARDVRLGGRQRYALRGDAGVIDTAGRAADYQRLAVAREAQRADGDGDAAAVEQPRAQRRSGQPQQSADVGVNGHAGQQPHRHGPGASAAVEYAAGGKHEHGSGDGRHEYRAEHQRDTTEPAGQAGTRRLHRTSFSGRRAG